jgi:DNA-binding winged helix-turn-helix (wHTH) protein
MPPLPHAGAAKLLFIFEDFSLDTGRRELRRGSETVAITPQAFDLLEYLVRNRDRVLSKDDLIASIWDGRAVSESALTTRINAARCAITDTGNEQRLIRTVPRKGVRFVGVVREERSHEVGSGVKLDQPALSLPVGRRSRFFRLAT